MKHRVAPSNPGLSSSKACLGVFLGSPAFSVSLVVSFVFAKVNNHIIRIIKNICAFSKQSCDRKGAVTAPAASNQVYIERTYFL